ncbi:MAG TPA: superoxide dismutase, partial [Gemmatimonadaceae bacterium]
MAFTLPPLRYKYDALEPHIDARTMEIHHTKHHQAYVNNLNAAIEKAQELDGRSLDDLMRGVGTLPESVRTAFRTPSGTDER